LVIGILLSSFYLGKLLDLPSGGFLFDLIVLSHSVLLIGISLPFNKWV
jgi:hypothetical protein